MPAGLGVSVCSLRCASALLISVHLGKLYLIRANGHPAVWCSNQHCGITSCDTHGGRSEGILDMWPGEGPLCAGRSRPPGMV